jgi:hypothetical protein
MRGDVVGGLAEALGATMVDDATFALPRGELREFEAKFRQLGLGLRSVNEVVGTNRRTGKEETILHLRAFNRDSEPAPDRDRGLMPRISWGPVRRYHDA